MGFRLKRNNKFGRGRWCGFMSDFKHKRRGFTIAELSLALGFVGILLMTVAALTIFISGVYQKGLTIKAVNTSGEALVDEFTRSIQAAVNLNSREINEDKVSATNGEKYDTFYRQWAISDNITINNSSGTSTGNTMSGVPTHGHFCTGTDSYIWNTGYVLGANANIFKKTNDDSALTGERAYITDLDEIHLLKVSGDTGRDVCNDNKITNNEKDYTTAVSGKETKELLPANSENPTVLYSLTLFNAATHGLTGHSYVSGTFILGTVRGSIDIFTNEDICKEDPTEGLSTDFNYCAINKFNFGVRATGKTNGS